MCCARCRHSITVRVAMPNKFEKFATNTIFGGYTTERLLFVGAFCSCFRCFSVFNVAFCRFSVIFGCMSDNCTAFKRVSVDHFQMLLALQMKTSIQEKIPFVIHSNFWNEIHNDAIKFMKFTFAWARQTTTKRRKKYYIKVTGSHVLYKQLFCIIGDCNLCVWASGVSVHCTDNRATNSVCFSS